MIHKIKGLHINESGNRKNKTILFIHGFPFEHSMWAAQAQALNNDFHCITYDIRGFGKSVIGDAQFSMKTYVDDLFQIIKTLRLRKPILCGLSMGGYIALRAAQIEPEKFSALILADTKSEADGNAAKLNRSESISTINEKGLSKFIKELMPNLFSETTKKKNKKLISGWIDHSSYMNPKAVKSAQLAMMSRLDTTEFLEEIEIPVLLIAGKEDKLTPPEVMKKMKQKIKNSVYKEIPDAGHLSPLENPEAVNSAIKEFIDSL